MQGKYKKRVGKLMMLSNSRAHKLMVGYCTMWQDLKKVAKAWLAKGSPLGLKHAGFCHLQALCG
jgi:hypothetical protein